MTSPTTQSSLLNRSNKVYGRKHESVKPNVGAQSKTLLPKPRPIPDLIPLSSVKMGQTPGLLDGIREKLRKIVYGLGPSTLLATANTNRSHSIDLDFSDPNFGTLHFE